MSHLKSRRFKVLRGAVNLLKEPYEMWCFTPVSTRREWRKCNG